MKCVALASIALCGSWPCPALAQDKLTKPAGIERPEIMKAPPQRDDTRSLRTDTGPGIRKEQVGKPVMTKNSNPGQGVRKESYDKPKSSGDRILTTGDSNSGPGDAFKKQQKMSGGTRARSGSDEGGDVEDLELQR